MLLYPTIELQNGRCVSLFRGRLDEPQIWHVDPVKKAREFAEAGAEWIHITDFDALAGEDRNRDVVNEIIKVVGVPVQLGGGFRTLPSIEDGIDRGVGRIVLGTIALLQPDLVKQAAHAFPDQIALAVDVYQDRIMSDGWRHQSAYGPEEFLQMFQNDLLAAIIMTDIDANFEEAEDALSLVTRLAQVVRTPVITRGLVRSLDDVSRLKYTPYISGAIVGRALFDRSIKIEDALAIAAEPLGKKAEFL